MSVFSQVGKIIMIVRVSVVLRRTIWVLKSKSHSDISHLSQRFPVIKAHKLNLVATGVIKGVIKGAGGE